MTKILFVFLFLVCFTLTCQGEIQNEYSSNLLSNHDEKTITDSEEKKYLIEAFKIFGNDNDKFVTKNMTNKYKDMSEIIAWAREPDLSNPNKMNFLLSFFTNELNLKGNISAYYKEIEPLESKNKIGHFRYYVLLSNSNTNKIFGFAMSTGLDMGTDDIKENICEEDISGDIIEKLKKNGFSIFNTKKDGMGNNRKNIYLRRNSDFFKFAVVRVSPIEMFLAPPMGYYINVALSDVELN